MAYSFRFRGWDAVGCKGWVYGDLVHNMKVTKKGLEPRVMVGGYEVFPDSVGIGSGILDAGGNEIFVGDIIRIYDSEYDSFSDCEVILKYGVIGVCSSFDILTTLSFFFSFRNGAQVKNEDNEYTVNIVGNSFINSLKY